MRVSQDLDHKINLSVDLKGLNFLVSTLIRNFRDVLGKEVSLPDKSLGLKKKIFMIYNLAQIRLKALKAELAPLSNRAVL